MTWGGTPRTDENLSLGFAFLASFRVALRTPGPAVLNQRPLTLCYPTVLTLSGPPWTPPAIAKHLLGITPALSTPSFKFSITQEKGSIRPTLKMKKWAQWGDCWEGAVG